MSYRSAPQEEPAREVSFRALSPETQQRLSAACSGHGATPLLAHRPALLGSPARWAALLLAAAVLLAPVLLAGVGTLRNGPRVYSEAERAALALGASAILLAVLLGARSARIRRGLPFPPGVYLFARELIDARSPALRLLPTTQLRGARRVRRRVELSFDGGERFSFPLASGEAADDIEREIKAALDALLRAESTGDAASRLRLDPFEAERSRWSEQPPPAAPARTPLRGSPWPLVALGLGVGPALGLLGSGALARASDAWGIHRARLASDEVALYVFLRSSPGASANRQLADDALFTIARSSDTNEALLHYLTVARDARRSGDAPPLAHEQEASDELHRRLVHLRDVGAASDLDPTLDLARSFVALGVGPLRDQEDQALFDAALSHRNCLALGRYAAVGARGDEVRALHLPRCQLDQAIEKRDLDELRRLARASASEEVRLDAAAALEREYKAARDRLARVTGLRTSLARALDEALLDAQHHGEPLVLSPGSSDALLGPARTALEIYIDQALLPLRNDHPAGGATPPTLLLSHRATAGCQPHKMCEFVLELTFQKRRDQAAPPPQAADLPPQTLRFKSLSPNESWSSDKPSRSFNDAAQEALVHALLGDTK